MVIQEPVEQPPFSIAEEKNQTVLKTKQVKKLGDLRGHQTCVQICY